MALHFDWTPERVTAAGDFVDVSCEVDSDKCGYVGLLKRYGTTWKIYPAYGSNAKHEHPTLEAAEKDLLRLEEVYSSYRDNAI